MSTNATRCKIFGRRELPTPASYYPSYLKKIGALNASGWALGLCPFHDDHKPSLALNMKTGGFYCFACGAKGGGIIDFHMKLHGLSFKETMKEIGGAL
ncbi:MAG: CHC2 zinc finger domain-containing protein [Nitrospinota bacterium]|nr:CHC2 zinc finger domain-containing protein [Nitrospinota bacterium]